MIKRVVLYWVILVLTINLSLLFMSLIEFLCYRNIDDEYSSRLTFEPIGPPRNETILLIHGFIGSPFDFDPWISRLLQEGYKVEIASTPNQGARVFPLFRGRWNEDAYIHWLYEEIDRVAKRDNTKPHIVGFSMGGTIISSAIDSLNVCNIVLVNPYYGLPDPFIERLIPYVRHIFPLLPKISKGRINSSIGYERYFPGSYIISMESMTQLSEMADASYHRIRKSKKDVFFVLSKNDLVADYQITRKLIVNNRNFVSKVFFESNHILSYDYESQHALTVILEWLQREPQAPYANDPPLAEHRSAPDLPDSLPPQEECPKY